VLIPAILVIAASGWIGYLALANAFGKSAGKEIAGLDIVDAGGQHIGIPRGLLRAVTTLTFLFTGLILIDYGWMLIDGRKRTLHDHIAGSYVVQRAKRGAAHPIPAAS
jgi:uncharacterized RDD family membrane protein YckC